MTTAVLDAPPVTSAALTFDAPDAIWGVGSAPMASGLVHYPLSNRDVLADVDWAEGQLRALGVEAGSLIDLVHNYSECGQFWPYYLAAMRLGAQVMNGMATPWDAGRVEMYARRFPLHAVLGVTKQTVDGLAMFGLDAAKVFGDLPVVGARGPAAAALEALGLRPHRMTLLGPLILIAAPGEDAAYDTAEWTLETDGEGRILVTSGPGRAARYERLDTGFRGRVADGRVSLKDGE
ncbi:hypothetical protein [Caulobacter sp. Root1472]|uniref:hypothetical protein n=1 Tax=Caulobacter sp. Root1472 TaxID=1736470 RepID=UPI0006F52733|nr:hypothetical protein [Caulobacter sp. Root1472]KQZ29963.1 hypothetical protein ASD47_04095 [Caulobacter sp. Root1472]